MKKFRVIFFSLFIPASILAEAHVFWYKALNSGYNLHDSNPGPNLPSNSIIHEGVISTGSMSQASGVFSADFEIGSGTNDLEAKCAFFVSKDLHDFTGSITSAKLRGEFKDGWCGSQGGGNALCNQGPIKVVAGVTEIHCGTYDSYMPKNKTWNEVYNPLAPYMNFDASCGGAQPLKAVDTFTLSVPTGRPSDGAPSVLDGKFFEMDVTNQVRFILSNNNSYRMAIVFLVDYGTGSTGKISLYGREALDFSETITCTSDFPWTKDGNSIHLIADGNLTKDSINPLGISPDTVLAEVGKEFHFNPTMAGYQCSGAGSIGCVNLPSWMNNIWECAMSYSVPQSAVDTIIKVVASSCGEDDSLNVYVKIIKNPVGVESPTKLGESNSSNFNAFPIPSHGATDFSFSVSTQKHVSVSIYSVSGSLIRSLFSRQVGPGFYRVSWDGRGGRGISAKSGVYVLKARLAEKQITKKILLIN